MYIVSTIVGRQIIEYYYACSWSTCLSVHFLSVIGLYYRWFFEPVSMLVTASKHDTIICLSAKGVNLFLWSLFLSVGKIVALANIYPILRPGLARKEKRLGVLSISY